MKRIAQIAFTLLISLLSFQSVFAQDELAISGGNIVSSLVCGNRRVFVWGGNQITGPNAVTGILGTGSPAPYLTTPTEVIFPSGNPSIKQVNSGSGAHFVALDCNTSVWAWGVNDNGQIGIGSNSAGVTTPTKVKAGVVTGTAFDDGAGNLTGVKTVYAGNVNSFAILTDGRLLSWGSNSSASTDASGELGDGTKINRATPVFVMDGSTNLPLTGVTKIFAGDNCAYALVDPVGNGVGTVYSWGAGLNGSLGRAITTGPNPANTATTQSSLAYPVTFKDGSPLNTIVQISAGDVFGMALDQDGTIWAWGNGGWGGCTGTGTFTTTHSDPRRVLAGQAAGTADAINISGTEYLVASFIGAGQGFAMAVTQSGIPMAWGNNGGNPGGVLGNGGAATSYVVPQYIINKATGVSDNNVIYINRGDTWGFYVTAGNKYYTWGYNGQGQLGTNSTTTETMAVPISPPSGCAFKDPAPDAKIKPTKLTVCASKFTTQLLTNSFSITDPTIAARYAVKWYKNGTQQGATLNATTGRTFAANSLGLYKVTVDYIGSNGECKPYPQAVDTMSIVGYPKTYTVPALTYCGTTATVNVTSTATTKARYDCFPTVGSTTSLGFSAGSATTSIDVSGIVANGAGDKIVYVEETGYASGTVFKKTDACDPFTTMDFLNTGANNPNFQSQFTSYEPIKLTEVKIRLENEIYNAGGSYTGTVNFKIYGSKSTAGGPVADQASVLGSFSYTYTRTRAAADPQIATQDVTIPLNISLPPVANGQVFFLSPDPTTLTSVTTGGGALKLGRANCAQTVPKVDDVNGTIVAYTGMSQNFSNNQTGGNIGGGHFFDVKFATAQKFCDRTLVTLKQQCPCAKPASVTITSNPAAAGSPKSVTICQDATYPTLTGAYTAGSVPSAPTNNYFYTWYKKGVAIPAYTNSTNKLDNNTANTGKPTLSSIADSGTYYLRVEDYNGSAVSSSCYREDSIHIIINKKPSLLVTNPTAVCAPNTVDITKTTVWTDANSTNATITYHSATPTTAGNAITLANAKIISTSGTYYIKALNGLCSDEKPVVVTINPAPTFTITQPAAQCAGTVDLSGTTSSPNPAGTIYKYFSDTTAAALGSPTVSTSGTYYIQGTANGCSTKFKPYPVTVTIDKKPNISVTNPGSKCAPGTVDITASTVWSDANSTSPTVTYHNATPAAAGNAITSAAAISSSGTYYIKAVKGTCTDEKPVTVIINPVPTFTIASIAAQCQGTSVDLSTKVLALNPATAVLSYYKDTTAAAITSTVNASGTYYIKATGPAPSSCVTKYKYGVSPVTINPLPTGSIAGTNLQFCSSPNTTNNKATVTITFTGTPPYDFSYNGNPSTGTKSVAGHTTNSFVFNPTTAETFTLTALKETSGCTATSMTGSVATSLFVDPVQVGSPTLICDPANPVGGAAGTYKYKIEFTGNLGDAASYAITAKDQANAAVTGSFTGSKWTSAFVNESQTVSLSFTDKNNCNPVIVSGLNKKCSCPEVATISFANVASGKICEQGDSSSIRLNVSTNVVAPQTYTFNVKDASGTIVATQATVPVKVSKIGLYTVTDFKGSCEGSTNSVEVKYYPSPAGTITALDDKFCQAGGDKGEVGVSVSNQSLAPYSIVVARTVGADTTLNLPILANIKFKTDKAATYTIKSLKDANTCTAKTADINTTSAILTSVVLPKANISTPPNAYADPYNVNRKPGDPDIQLAADAVGAGYVGTWAKFGQGTIDANGLLKGVDIKETNPSTGVGTTKVVYTVSDAGNVCVPAKDSVKIVNVDKTIPNAGPDQTICSTNLPKVLTGGPSNLIQPFETAAWVNVDPIATANNEKLTINAGAPAGKYKFYYEVTNTVTGKTKDSVFVTIIAPPVADITSPSNAFNSPFSVNKKTTDNLQLQATAPGAGYTGKWEIIKGQGQITQNGLLDKFMKYEPTPSNGDGTTQIRWTVRDDSSACKPARDSVIIVNVDKNIPNAGPDLNLCTTTLPKVITGTPTSLIPVFETSKWTDLNSPAVATISGNDLTIPSGTAAGTYQFEFSITNTAGTTTTLKDTVKVRIDEETKVPTFSNFGAGPFTAANPYVICTPSLTLAGDKNTQTLGKNWWTKTGGSGTGTLPALDSTNNPLLSGISGQVTFGYNYKNGVCPAKTTTFVLEKLGNITSAIVTINGGKAEAGTKQYTGGFDSPITASATKADTLCLGGTYTLKANPYNLANESGTWSLENGISVSVTPVDNTTRTLQALTVGTSIIKWKVASTVIATCKPDSVIMTVFVRDIPSGGTLSGGDFHCEGADSLYKVIPLPNPSLPVTYTWDAGANTGVFRTGAQKGESTRYRMYSNTAGTITSGNVSVTPSNACGAASPLSMPVGIRLAPRPLTGINPGDSIMGPRSFCASSDGARFILNGHSDVKTFNWYWADSLAATTNNTTTDSAVILYSSHWDRDAKADKDYILKAELTNRCSDTARKNSILPVVIPKKVTLKAPVDVKVKLNVTPQFCMPNQAVPFYADSITAFAAVKKTYEFSLVSALGTNNILQTGPSDKYLAPVGLLKDGDKVIVKIIPDANPKQCVTYPVTPFSDEIVMEGFDYPPSDIENLTPIICENNSNGIRLKVDQKATSKGSRWDNKDIKWSKDGLPLSQFDGKFEIVLRSIDESGDYTVTVGSNPLGCATHVSTTALAAKTKIWEKPAAVVLANPFPVPYTEGINIYHMPVVVTKPIKDTLTKSEYFPNTWLEKPNNPTTLLLPEKEDKEITYTLTLETGNGVCQTPIQVTVVYFLPIDIPNAFTPNGDGLNDDWVIKGLGKYPGTKVKVYNRWGSSMYIDNDGYKAVWNGTHNGEPLPAGTYYYIVELKGSPDNTDQSKTGALTIIR